MAADALTPRADATRSEPILLWGPMGVGKTTLGARLAEQLGLPFVDVDAEIEALVGERIPEIFARGDEAAFRARESAFVRAALESGEPRVIALGGGALVDPTLAEHALRAATVITLRASADTLWERASHGPRPLLASADGRAALDAILTARSQAYARGHLFVDAEGDKEEVFARLTLTLASAAVLLRTRDHVSTILFPTDLAATLQNQLAGLRATSVFFVCDRDVESALSERLSHGVFSRHPRLVVEPGESTKRLATLEKLAIELVAQGADRRTVLVGLGGGVVTDMTGFLASMFMRGVRWIAIPTTLVGMVDAAIGGKTAVDLAEGKNLLGAFHHPDAVLIDPTLLTTLAPREYRAGLGELVKTLAVGDGAAFDSLDVLTNTPDPDAIAPFVERAARIKADVVSRDPRETKRLRTLLNFGHTLGHALEASAHYEGLRHGEAVAIGMVHACWVGEALGVTPNEVTRTLTRVLERLRLPVTIPRAQLEESLAYLTRDKKRTASSIDFVALERLGRAIVVPLPVIELASHYLAAWDARAKAETP